MKRILLAMLITGTLQGGPVCSKDRVEYTSGEAAEAHGLKANEYVVGSCDNFEFRDFPWLGLRAIYPLGQNSPIHVWRK